MKVTEIITEAANPAQQAAIAISMKKAGKKPKNESTELEEEFDLIESIINRLAEHNGVDAEVVWEDLETLTEDELYAFAVTSEPIMESQGVSEGGNDTVNALVSLRTTVKQIQTGRSEYPQEFASQLEVALYDAINALRDSQEQGAQNTVNELAELRAVAKQVQSGKIKFPQGYAGHLEWVLYDAIKQIESSSQGVAEDWQKANKRDRTDGMSQKAVNAYRRENPGSKLKTAVTTKPSKLKKGGKASKRRKSYCSRSRGQMKMHSISCAKTPDKAICKARRRWNC